MAFRVQFNRRPNITRVVTRVFVTILALYVGGVMLNVLGTIMLNQCSVLYQGLTLIGWTVNTSNCITATDGTGILAIIGIVGIASVVLEFVRFRL